MNEIEKKKISLKVKKIFLPFCIISCVCKRVVKTNGSFFVSVIFLLKHGT